MDFFQDLDLHQSFLKRVKVLVATFGELANQLLEEEQEKTEVPPADVAADHVVSPDLPISSGAPASLKTPLSASWISFRSKRHLDQTAALADSLRHSFPP